MQDIQFRRMASFCSTGERGSRETNTSKNLLIPSSQMNTLLLIKMCCKYMPGMLLCQRRVSLAMLRMSVEDQISK